MSSKVFSKLLGTTSLSDFFSDVLEQKVLHSQGCFEEEELLALLSPDHVNSLFSKFPLHPMRYQLISNGTVDRSPPQHPAGGMDPEYMLEAFQKGQTVRVNSVHEVLPAVRVLCRELAAECKCPIFANIYVTPAQNPGFDPHYDDHDVIIIQCHGSKEWRIHDEYDNQVELPLPGFEFDSEKYSPGPISHRMILEPGDTLYIPRGRMHSACAQSSDSVHITLSLNWPTWNELLVDVIARGALANVALRRSIAPMFATTNGSSIEPDMKHLKGLLELALDPSCVKCSLSELMSESAEKYFDDTSIEIIGNRSCDSTGVAGGA